LLVHATAAQSDAVFVFATYESVPWRASPVSVASMWPSNVYVQLPFVCGFVPVTNIVGDLDANLDKIGEEGHKSGETPGNEKKDEAPADAGTSDTLTGKKHSNPYEELKG
jgi:hypothetical protein